MNSRIPLSVRLLVYALLVILFWMVLVYLKKILIPIAFAFLLAILLYPMVRWMERKGVNQIIAILSSMVAVLILLTTVLFVISSQVVNFSKDIPVLTQKITVQFNYIQNFVSDQFGIDPQNQIELLRKNTTGFLKSSGSFFNKAVRITTNFFTQLSLIPVYAFLFLLYRNLFKKVAFNLAPKDKHTKVDDVIQKIQQVGQNYIAGMFMVIFIIAVLNSIGLAIVGVKYAVFFGVLAAFLTIIPYIGIMVGAIFPLLYTYLTGDSMWQPIGVIIVFVVVQALEGNIITPKVLGSKVSINALTAIVALILASQLWGTAGMVLAIPYVAIIKVIFDSVDPLKPFGLLLGAVVDDRQEKNSFEWKGLFKKIFKKKGA